MHLPDCLAAVSRSCAGYFQDSSSFSYDMVSPLGFSLASLAFGPSGLPIHSLSAFSGLSLGGQFFMPARSSRDITSSISLASLSIAACGVSAPDTASLMFDHHSCASLG